MDIVQKSLMNKVKKFTENLSDQEFFELEEYLMYGYIEKPFNNIQHNFVKDLFGEIRWLKVLQYVRLPESEQPQWGGERKTLLLLREVLQYLHFYSHMRMGQLLVNPVAKINNNPPKDNLTPFKKKLSKELEKAMNNSYYDGVFDKIEGFCNLADVLEDYGLIKREE